MNSTQSVTVVPESVKVAPGASVQVKCEPRDSFGNIIVGRRCKWSSLDPSIVTIGSATFVITQTLTGVANGVGRVWAQNGAHRDTVKVVVATDPVTSSCTTGCWHVAPNGTSTNAGTDESPWSFPYAITGAGGRVQPGDTVWIHGGRYSGFAPRATVAGVAGNPIVFRAAPGERPVFDAVGVTSTSSRGDYFVVSGANTVWWGLEFTHSGTNRQTTTRSNMIVNNATNTRYVNLVVHDGGIGFYTYASKAAGVEVVGCLFYNNGWLVTRGGGHALYIKSDAGPVTLRNNMIWGQFGYGIHAYSESGSGGLKGIKAVGNTSFNNSTPAGTQSGSQNILFGGSSVPVSQAVVDSNATYFTPGWGVYNATLGYGTTQSLDLVARGNWFHGGSARALRLRTWSSLMVQDNALVTTGIVVSQLTTAVGQSFSGNTHYRSPTATAWQVAGTDYTFADWQAKTGATDQASTTLPASPTVLVRASPEPGWGFITVYNWPNAASVAVDLSGVVPVGGTYAIRSAVRPFDPPLAGGTYEGGSVSVPLTAVTPVAPIGWTSAAPSTGTVFGAFRVTPQ